MNAYKWVVTVVMAAGLCLIGCSKKTSVDTGPLEKGFRSAEPAMQSSAEKVVASIKSADYAGAMTELKTLSSNAKLTPEQQQAVKYVMGQVQQALGNMGEKAKGEADKALDNAKQALPK